MSAELIDVEVAYALPDQQAIVPLQVPAGTTAMQAARLSKLEEQFAGLTLDDSTRLGVFGHIVAHTQALRAGDRVEIYRPLLADPKEVRKARAARAKARRAGEADGE